MHRIIEYISYFGLYEKILFRYYNGMQIIESLIGLKDVCSFFVEFSNEVGEYAIRYGNRDNNVDICYSSDKLLCEYFSNKYNNIIEYYSEISKCK